MTTASARARRTGHPGYELDLDRLPQAAKEARSLVRVVLAAWGLEEHADTGTLLVSELVANAVRHSRGTRIRVHVERPAPDQLRFAVVDYAPDRLPQSRTPGPDAVSGRGLPLIDEIADRWGYIVEGPASRPRTKRVWAELQVAVTP